jgi:CubicO group peptidase (beta-lactamase class C family)
MNRRLQIIKILLGVLIGFVAVGVILLLINYPAEYLRRLVVYQVSDVNDYKIFPAAAIQAARNPIPFQSPADPGVQEAKVQGWFEQDPLIERDLETFLNETGTQAFIVIQNEMILYEKYFNGTQRDSIVTSFSAAKSFVSTLVGIAIAEGKIQSIDDPITRYLPELKDRDLGFESITIRHLLDMSSGIQYVENGFINGDDALTYYYPDLRQLALEKTHIAGEPGQTWLYNNYHPLLLGLILERATGVPVSKYLETKVWQTIGAEYPASWSVDSQQTAFEKMESGINARAIDFAKLGRLYLNMGSVNGRQIITAEWVQQATILDPTVNRAEYYPVWMDQPYGQVYHQRMWWGVRQENGNTGYAAQGNYGQEIFVYPEKSIIIVRNGEKYGIQPEQWLRLFMNFSQKVE